MFKKTKRNQISLVLMTLVATITLLNKPKRLNQQEVDDIKVVCHVFSLNIH